MTPFFQTIGWALIHFVWQGVAIAAAASALLTLARRRSSSVRYAIAGISLAAMLAAPLISARLLWTMESSSTSVPSLSDAAAEPGNRELADTVQPVRPAVWNQRTSSSAVGLTLVNVPSLESHPADDHHRVACRCRASSREDGRRLVARSEAAPARARDEFLAMADGVPPAGVPARASRRRPRRRVGARRRAHRRRLAASGDPASDRRAGVADAGAGRSDPRSRARAHTPSRLRGQPAADDRRDPAFLSPGRVVDLEPNPCGARALLRRHCDRCLRRSARIRAGAGRARDLAHVGRNHGARSD